MHPISTFEVVEFYSRMRVVIDAQSWSGRLLDIVLLGLEPEALKRKYSLFSTLQIPATDHISNTASTARNR